MPHPYSPCPSLLPWLLCFNPFKRWYFVCYSDFINFLRGRLPLNQATTLYPVLESRLIFRWRMITLQQKWALESKHLDLLWEGTTLTFCNPLGKCSIFSKRGRCCFQNKSQRPPLSEAVVWIKHLSSFLQSSSFFFCPPQSPLILVLSPSSSSLWAATTAWQLTDRRCGSATQNRTWATKVVAPNFNH